MTGPSVEQWAAMIREAHAKAVEAFSAPSPEEAATGEYPRKKNAARAALSAPQARVEAAERRAEYLAQYEDRGDFVVYRDEWDALVTRQKVLAYALDGLYEAHGCRDKWGNRNPTDDVCTCGECADALAALADAPRTDDRWASINPNSTSDDDRCERFAGHGGDHLGKGHSGRVVIYPSRWTDSDVADTPKEADE